MKKSNRKGFNFYASYFEVYQELNDKDKVKFMDALLNRQFYGVEPSNLSGMAKFAYLSQQHSIDRQIKGFEDKTNTTLAHPTQGGSQGGSVDPYIQVKEKEKEKEKEQEEKNIKKRKHQFENSVLFDFDKWVELIPTKDGKYKNADFKYYYETISLWAQSKGAMQLDWIAFVRGWMNRDMNDGKYKGKKTWTPPNFTN